MRPRKQKTPETILKNAAKDLLTMYKITTWPLTAGLGSVPGLPDRIGVLPGGRFLAIEFKLPERMSWDGRRLPPTELTDIQEKVRKEIEAAGGVYIVCRCLEDIIDGLGLQGRLF